MFKKLLFGIGVFFLVPTSVLALDTPNPDLVVDQANVLSANEEESLRAKLLAEQERSGTQLAVLIIASLEGQALEDYSIQVAREWGIGRDDLDNGALILVSVDDRLVRIEVGRGLEGALTDIESGRIIDNRIRPAFQEGEYSAGLESAVEGIALAIADEFDPLALEQQATPNEIAGSVIAIGVFALGLLQWLISVLARSKSWWAGGIVGSVIGVIVGSATSFGTALPLIIIGGLGLGIDYLVSKNFRAAKQAGRKPAWWAGGNASRRTGRSSGGFRGFGGGGFGGGGASGGW